MRPVRDADGAVITPHRLLHAYAERCFPMADGRDGPIAWYRPATRAVITWDAFTVPRSLAKTARRRPYRITCDLAFERVIAACADRRSTWISHGVERLYAELHRLGFAHSIEAWSADGELVGGCYGLALGAAFSGESMFHRADDASKLCVLALVGRLRRQGFALLDCQQQTPHMERFGAREIADADYADLLAPCLRPCDFGPPGELEALTPDATAPSSAPRPP